MASDLKPCPFCGGEPTLNDPGGSQLADCYDIAIRCRDCDAEVSGLVDQDYCDDGGAEVRGEVVAAWNRRAPADLSAAEAAAAREMQEKSMAVCDKHRAFAASGGPHTCSSISGALAYGREQYATVCRQDIAALAQPPPGALDRVRQAARDEGMEDAAKAMDRKAFSAGGQGQKTTSAIYRDAAAAIRAAKDQPA